MKGEDMLNALSYIDEVYIAEAENAKLTHKGIWLKIGSAAACLCLLLGTLYALRQERIPAESQDGKQEILAGGAMESADASGPRGPDALAEESIEIMEPSAYSIATREIRTDGGSEETSFPFVTVLRSREELEDYCHTQGERFDLESGFLEACKVYDTQFFTDNDLILLCVEENNGSVPPQVTDFRWEEGAWVITVEKDASAEGAEDMAQWHILIEVQMGKVITPENRITVRLENEEN